MTSKAFLKIGNTLIDPQTIGAVELGKDEPGYAVAITLVSGGRLVFSGKEEARLRAYFDDESGGEPRLTVVFVRVPEDSDIPDPEEDPC